VRRGALQGDQPAGDLRASHGRGGVAGLEPRLAPRVRLRARPEARAYDPDGAKRLLAEAGYPTDSRWTLSATNNRYVNDEQIAQAVAQMLARVGVRARVEVFPINAYLPKARKHEFAFAMLGWGSSRETSRCAHSLPLRTPKEDTEHGIVGLLQSEGWTGLLERGFPASTKSAARRSHARRCGSPCGITP